MPKTVFVTVGTTEFDQLISVISSSEALRVLKSLGYQRLVLQIGRGKFEPESGVREGLQVTVYRYKSSIKDDIVNSDLIISHAGSGTCLEVLENNRRLLVVVNETLQDNHQFELARQLHKDGHLFYCTPETLLEALSSCDWSLVKPWVRGNPKLFADWLDSFIIAH